MTQELPESVHIPWVEGPVGVLMDDEPTVGGEHLALAAVSLWTDALKRKIERAAFADYLLLRDETGITEPVVLEPAGVWHHLKSANARAFEDDLVVISCQFGWHIERTQEWCVRGTDDLIYFGDQQVWDVEDYVDVNDESNLALRADDVIATLLR